MSFIKIPIKHRRGKNKRRFNERSDKNPGSTGCPLTVDEAANWCFQSETIRRQFPGITGTDGDLINTADGMKHLETGDIIFVTTPKLSSKFIRLLISTRYGIPYKVAIPHVEIVMNNTQNLSAEAHGVDFMERDRFGRGTKIEIYWLNNVTPDKKRMLQELSKDYIGKKYAYARYGLATSNIKRLLKAAGAGFFAALGAIFGWELLFSLAGVYCLVVLALTLLNIPLARLDKRCYDCTELVSELLARVLLWAPLEKPRCEHPNGMKQVLENLCLCEGARFLGELK